jgi:hypothetical protein
MIGVHNRGTVPFSLPPILPGTVKQPAALMLRVLCHRSSHRHVLTAGGSKKAVPEARAGLAKSSK